MEQVVIAPPRVADWILDWDNVGVGGVV